MTFYYLLTLLLTNLTDELIPYDFRVSSINLELYCKKLMKMVDFGNEISTCDYYRGIPYLLDH